MATQCPKNTVFRPKIGIFRLFLGKNGHFFGGGGGGGGGGGLNHPFSGSHTLQHMFF